MTPKEKLIEVFTDMQTCFYGLLSAEFICSDGDQEELNKEEADERMLLKMTLKELELEIIERCAKVAELQDPGSFCPEGEYTAQKIASEIRVLKEE